MKPWGKWSRWVPGSKTCVPATGSWCRSRSHAANAFSARAASTRAASGPTLTARQRKNSGAIRRQACSATRTSSAATLAARLNICACRTPMSDLSRFENGLMDEQVLFLSDIFPTGYMAADFCDIKGGETIAIWGCGPVGQFAIRSAFTARRRQGDRHRHGARASQAAREIGAETIDFKKDDVYERIQELTARPWRGCLYRCRWHRSRALRRASTP